MAEYALIESGKVVNVIVAPEGWPEGINITTLSPKPAIGWNFDGTNFTPETSTPPAALPITTTKMTHLGFIDRMTSTEWAAFEQLLASSADARFAKAKFDVARDVDVSRTDVQTFAYVLRAVGVLESDERVAALLAPIDINSPHALP